MSMQSPDIDRSLLTPPTPVGVPAIEPPRRAVHTPLEALFERNLLQHRRLFAELDAQRDAVCEAAIVLAEVLHSGGRLLFIAAPESEGLCLHLAALLNMRLARLRPSPVACALVADTPSLRALVAGSSHAETLTRQLAARARLGDCVVAICASDDSDCVVGALQRASAAGVCRVALLARKGGPARAHTELSVLMPHYEARRVQEAQLFVGHAWCSQIESALGIGY